MKFEIMRWLVIWKWCFYIDGVRGWDAYEQCHSWMGCTWM